MANGNYERRSVKVINPYTFVPITPQIAHKRFDAETYYAGEELHTGMLNCSLQVVTPLAIPDINEEQGEKTYNFYAQEGKVAIPGSSLRGMIRSAYETVTGSCFSTVKKDTPLSFRIEARNAYSPGIFKEENGRYRLYEAERSLLKIQLDGKEFNTENDYYVSTREHENAKSFVMSIDPKDKSRRISVEERNLATGELEEKYLKTGDYVWIETVPSKHNKRRTNRRVWKEGGVVQNLSIREQGVSKSTNDSKIKKGILYLGEPISGKHGESVFVQKSDTPLPGFDCSVKENEDSSEKRELALAYEKLTKTLNIYRSSVNKNLYDEKEERDSQKSPEKHRGYPDFENLDPKNGIPVWYHIENDKIYLSYAAIGRSMYKNTLNELLGGLDRCTDRSQLCETCLLFGMVGGSNQEKGMGSHIRVTDAYLDSEDSDPIGYSSIMLKELGMPRYSYLPFYAKNNNGRVLQSYDEDGSAIAGRKYYWHNINAQKEESSYRAPKDIEGTSAEARTIKTKLMSPGSMFSFNIYYDGITTDQLQKLLWVLTIGDNDLPKQLPYDIHSQDDLHCHKLGRGKPLGLGSVKIVVSENWEREWACTTGIYRLIKQNVDKKISVPEGLFVDDFCRVTSMKNPLDENSIIKGIKIDYPNILYEDNTAIPLSVQQGEHNNHLARHQWYSENRDDCKNGEEKTLPKITDKDQTLYQYRYVKNESNGNKGKNKYEEKSSEPDTSRVYLAIVLEEKGPARNPNFVEYRVEIQGESSFKNKTCIASARKEIPIKIGQTQKVTLYRDFGNKAIFNLAKR